MRYLTLILLIATSLTGCLERDDSDTTSVTAVDSTVTPNSFLTFVNQSLDINSEVYANAYYAAVDPLNQRTTLAEWKTVNEFDSGEDVHVTFRDTKDLGYGRDMYAKSLSNGGLAFYVDNYVVQLEAGDATTYGPLNLDAAIAQDRDFHIGTNAIEFSPDPNNPLGQKILKFFTFTPKEPNGVQRRLTAANLDGRGMKNMPMMCIVCHGGTLYPLRQDGSFDPIALKSPKLNMFAQDTFQFSSKPGFTEADQSDRIAMLNRLVYKAYREAGNRTDSNNETTGKIENGIPTVADNRDDDQANWSSSFGESLIEGVYGDLNPGDGVLEQNTSYQENFVPSGWQPSANRPGGVEALYKDVIEPHCIGCHSLRGTQVALSNNEAINFGQFPNSVNFSSYEEFIGYNDLIIDYVYQRGSMPRSLINFSQFWDNSNAAPTLLATYLSGFDIFDINGNVIMPGKAVARPGTDRTVAEASVSNPAILDATASNFSVDYSWRIVSSTDSSAALNDESSSSPELTAVDTAIVMLELTTSNAMGASEPVQVTINVDSTFPSPNPTFDTDILNVLESATCISCHSTNNSSSIEGIPVYYNVDSYSEKKDLYRNVLNRVDLSDPENSLLLRKPTSLQHGGSIVLDRTDPVENNQYLAILNWIRDGAPCGSDTALCD
ncbi:MAG: hypothetical protein V3W04_00775 [Gammaproteobacteria bacterium]